MKKLKFNQRIYFLTAISGLILGTALFTMDLAMAQDPFLSCPSPQPEKMAWIVEVTGRNLLATAQYRCYGKVLFPKREKITIGPHSRIKRIMGFDFDLIFPCLIGNKEAEVGNKVLGYTWFRRGMVFHAPDKNGCYRNEWLSVHEPVELFL